MSIFPQGVRPIQYYVQRSLPPIADTRLPNPRGAVPAREAPAPHRLVDNKRVVVSFVNLSKLSGSPSVLTFHQCRVSSCDQ